MRPELCGAERENTWLVRAAQSRFSPRRAFRAARRPRRKALKPVWQGRRHLCAQRTPKIGAVRRGIRRFWAQSTLAPNVNLNGAFPARALFSIRIESARSAARRGAREHARVTRDKEPRGLHLCADERDGWRSESDVPSDALLQSV
eukprot:scaffold1108_cov260-Pinguiococcus_pyrenoidosus.AAC.14